MRTMWFVVSLFFVTPLMYVNIGLSHASNYRCKRCGARHSPPDCKRGEKKKKLTLDHNSHRRCTVCQSRHSPPCKGGRVVVSKLQKRMVQGARRGISSKRRKCKALQYTCSRSKPLLIRCKRSSVLGRHCLTSRVRVKRCHFVMRMCRHFSKYIKFCSKSRRCRSFCARGRCPKRCNVWALKCKIYLKKYRYCSPKVRLLTACARTIRKVRHVCKRWHRLRRGCQGFKRLSLKCHKNSKWMKACR